MKYTVFLTDDALPDLEEIDDYLTAANSPQVAEDVCAKSDRRRFLKFLTAMPRARLVPSELLKLGIREYRGLFSRPYASFTDSGQKGLYYLVWMAQGYAHALTGAY